MRFNYSLRAALCAAMTLAAACHDSTSPGAAPVSFDPAHARARVEPLAKIFDQPIFRSFEGALSFVEPYFRSGGSLPSDVKGKTFVFDPASQSYVIDPAAVGVPPGAVRFALYAWESGSAHPATPLTRTGYVELAEVSAGVTAPREVELLVVRESPFLPVADFIVMHNAANGVDTFGIEGSATDGFTVGIVALDGTQSGPAGQHHLVYNVSLSTSPSDVSATEQLVYDQPTSSQSGSLALSYDGHTFSNQSVANGAELKFDGQLYARVLIPTNPQESLRYLRPDGTALPASEVANIEALLERVVVANFFWINLAWP